MEEGAEQKETIEASAEEAVVDSAAPSRGSLDLVIDVPLRLTVEVGSATMLVREALQLAKGSIVELDRGSGDPADILVNGRLMARGEVTVVDDNLAIRIVEMLGGDPPPKRGR